MKYKELPKLLKAAGRLSPWFSPSFRFKNGILASSIIRNLNGNIYFLVGRTPTLPIDELFGVFPLGGSPGLIFKPPR